MRRIGARIFAHRQSSNGSTTTRGAGCVPSPSSAFGVHSHGAEERSIDLAWAMQWSGIGGARDGGRWAKAKGKGREGHRRQLHPRLGLDTVSGSWERTGQPSENALYRCETAVRCQGGRRSGRGREQRVEAGQGGNVSGRTNDDTQDPRGKRRRGECGSIGDTHT